jgi:transcriptional regulator with XRE-family HTH domain
MAESSLSQNHWANQARLCPGHWSEIVNGKHLYPSPRTRERMLEVFGVPFDQLFLIEKARSRGRARVQAGHPFPLFADPRAGAGGMGLSTSRWTSRAAGRWRSR